MSNEFDQEMRDLRRSAGSRRDTRPEASGLADLKEKLTGSEYVAHGKIGCEQDGEELKVSVKGQVIGIWKADGAQLLLFRPGIAQPECTASGVVEAAKVSARLVAAVAQA
jgi:hypothetical protein